jgi:hypothetical protein
MAKQILTLAGADELAALLLSEPEKPRTLREIGIDEYVERLRPALEAKLTVGGWTRAEVSAYLRKHGLDRGIEEIKQSLDRIIPESKKKQSKVGRPPKVVKTPKGVKKVKVAPPGGSAGEVHVDPLKSSRPATAPFVPPGFDPSASTGIRPRANGDQV